MNYPFILCPPGRSVGDTHREWESLYLGSVPVVEDTKYLRKLYSGYPVLFVRDFKEVDSALLLDNLHLVSALRQKSLHEFDARRIYAERIMSSLSRS